MKFKLSKKIIGFLFVVMVFISLSFQSKFFEVAKQIEIYNTLFKELNMYYVDEINPAEITTKAIKNTLKDLDPYTNFYNEQEVEDAKINKEGEYSGIGVAVNFTDLGIEINEIFKGFSADKAGLKVADLITSIEGQSLKNMQKDQLSMLLKGVPNSSFNLEVVRQGNILKKEITRDKVVVNPVPFAEMIDHETGYIVLTRFNDKASSEVQKAYLKLKKEGLKKLIFDLRSNPGGSLLESINIANFFLPKGKTIVSTKAKVKQWSNTYTTKNQPLDLEIPIVVLVNEYSASASEIVSGSLQDYDRAVIMGKRTFGKGLVQRFRELTYGTQLKVTISKYYTPSGRCIQELDYANRDANGNVPKFSDHGVQKFTTENGRTVYDGGGILPDIMIETSKKTAATETLLSSRAIFNFCTHYYYNNPTLQNANSYRFTESDFKDFTNYLKTDTTFVTKQEALFKKAYLASKNNNVTKEYNQIKEKLFEDKIAKISENIDIITPLITEGIIERYFYKEGLYANNLKNDASLIEALALLKNQSKYKEILSVK